MFKSFRFFAGILLPLLFVSAASGQLTLLYQINGAAAADNFGWSVAGAGDVDGNGTADFIVGARTADPGGLSGAGSVYVYSGFSFTGVPLYQKDGAAAGDNLGYSAAGAGDVNGDGKADFIIGAPYADPGGLADAGSAFVYSGATGLLLYQKNGAAANDLLGFSVASAGDVNKDGNADFIIGAYQADPGGLGDAGSAFVYSGLTGALLYQKNGAAAGDNLGISVASAGDVNGDGNDDFIAGAPGADPVGLSGAGSVYVYSGIDGALLFQKNGAATFDQLGSAVASAGDVNGDGNADFIIGAFFAMPGGRFEAGSAFVYSGFDGALLYQKNGAAAGDFLGWSVASAGDVNADGKSDFIIGAPFASPGSLINAGSAYIYSGETGALLFRINGAAAGDNLGWSVAGAGDFNGDLVDDIIAGAPFASPGGLSSAGSVYLYGLGNTPAGGPVVVDLPGGITLVFDSVSVAGNTRYMISSSGLPPINGSQLLPSGSPLYYDLTATCTFVGSVTICFLYDPTGLTPAQEAQIKLQHDVASSWIDVTIFLDTASNIVCGRVNSFSVFALMAPTSTDVPGGNGNRPHQFELSQNYPNPFNPTTAIRYFLPKRQKVTLEIFNLIGQRVKALADEEQPAGEHTLTWDGTDEKGKILPSGIYFYRLKGTDFSETKKMMLLK